MENTTELYAALRSLDEASADILTKPGTEAAPLAVSFLTSHQILRILWRRVLSPVMFYVGFAAPDSVFMLTGNPEAFIKMSQADKVSLGSPEQALEYFSTFLEVTRTMKRLFYQVGSVEEILWRKTMQAAELQRMQAVQKKYKDSLAPRAETAGYRYQVSRYAMQDTDLVHFEAFITAGGAMELKTEIVEKNLPAAYAA